MRKRFFLILLMVFSTVTFVSAARVASLPELFTPLTMAVDDQQLYVVDKAVVYIYSLEDFSMKAKFGKAGEGPQEFKVSPGGEGVMVYPQTDFLLVNSPGKLSFYSKRGQFIKEMKAPPSMSSGQSPMIQPIDGKFVGMASTLDRNTASMTITLNLYSGQLEKIKELKRMSLMKSGKMVIPMLLPLFYVWDNKIIGVGDKEGLSIEIIDADGKQVSSIEREYKRLKVTESYKKAAFETFEIMPDTKQFIDIFKRMIEFQDYFPVVQYFWVADGKVYVLTYLQEDGKHEFFVFDVKGKLLRRLFLPVSYMYGVRPAPHAVKNDKFYQVVENEEEEEWELHITPIK